MSRFTTVCIAALVFTCASVAQAHVTAGASCANCHSPETGRQSVSSAQTTNTTNNPGVTAGLPLFVAHPGDTISLPISVTGGGVTGDFYAVALTGLKSATTVAGILNAADTLTFTPDATWTARGSGSNSYATRGPFTWAGTTTNYGYALNINASTPADYYQLTLKATGVDNTDPNNADMWTQQQAVIIEVAAVPEPATLAVMGLAVGALALGRRRTA